MAKETTAAPSLPPPVLPQVPISPVWTAAARSYRATHPTNAPATANAAISTASTTPAPLCPAEASTRATIPPPASQINGTQSAKIVRAYKNLEIWTTVALSIPITVLPQVPISPVWTAAARSYRATHPTNAPATVNAVISNVSTTPAPSSPAAAATPATLLHPVFPTTNTPSAKTAPVRK